MIDFQIAGDSNVNIMEKQNGMGIHKSHVDVLMANLSSNSQVYDIQSLWVDVRVDYST
jgi:hypothetical protein